MVHANDPPGQDATVQASCHRHVRAFPAVPGGCPVRDPHAVRSVGGTIAVFAALRTAFNFHFTPTYRSWMSLVERWFSELSAIELQRPAPPESRLGEKVGAGRPPRALGMA